MAQIVSSMQIRIVSARESTPMYNHIDNFKERIIQEFSGYGNDIEVIYQKNSANVYCNLLSDVFAQKTTITSC